MEYIFDEIECCECIGEFEEEYVYDIEMADETHTFIANDILVHNSLYMSYDNLLHTVKGYEDMTRRQKLDLIISICTDFLDDHNEEFMRDYFNSRHVKSVQKFELETVNLRGSWLDVKKRYCQILLWKDGKYYDDDALPMKTKGLEMIKASYPKYVRGALKRVVRAMLETDDDKFLWEHLNQKVQVEKAGFYEADIDDICANQGINGYNKYIASGHDYDDKGKRITTEMAIDNQGDTIFFYTKAPAHVKALAVYNTIRENHHLQGDPIYGGKCKLYFGTKLARKGDDVPFAYQARNYPKWAPEYVPVDRGIMFEKYFLAPLNRICHEAAGLPEFHLDGSKELDLFSAMEV